MAANQPGRSYLAARVERPAVPGGPPYWGRIARLDPLARTLVLMEEMMERLAAKGLDVREERLQLVELRRRQAALTVKAEPDAAAEEALYLDARMAKRRLMFRDPDLDALAPGPLRQTPSLSLVAQL